MARSVTNLFAINTSATAGNLNAGGFNPANANFPTDLATTSGTSATPTVSAAYAFVTATDVNAWVYVKSGTNWIQGFYKITSQSGGVATLDASIGAAVIWDATTGSWIPSTAQGCATQDTPGGNATYGVDYSQTTASPWGALTDLASLTGTTNPSTVTSVALGTFTTNHIGNWIHITAGTNWTVNGTSTAGLQSWYEIVSVAAGVATLSDNQAVGSAATLTGGTFYLGGALSLGSSTANRTDDAVTELAGGTNGTGSTTFFIKSGTYTIANMNPAVTGGTQAPIRMIGFTSVRGDACTGTNRPLLTSASQSIGFSGNWDMYNLVNVGTQSAVVQFTGGGKAWNCKFTNTSTTTGRDGVTPGSDDFQMINCEMVSLRGDAIATAAMGLILGCYIHDSNIGIVDSGTGDNITISNCIIAGCATNAINISGTKTGRTSMIYNTLYGSANTTGTGVLIATGSTDMTIFNCIISGFVTGVVHADVQTVGFDDYNDYYNNDVDVAATAGGALDYTRWQKGAHDIAINPAFTSVTQITGTAGSISSANKLTDTTKDFTALGVAALDIVLVTSGTGATTGHYIIDSISTTTNANDTLNITIPASIGTNAAGNVAYQITLGHNFLPTGAI